MATETNWDMTICYVPGCTNEFILNNPQNPVYSWERWATEEEIADLKASGDLPQSETSARLTMLSCNEHAAENRHLTHESTCAAPDSPCCESGG